MLHGYTQSGPLFHAKTRALEKNLHKAFPGAQLVYPTAPIKLLGPDIPTWDNSGSSSGPVAAAEGEEPDVWGWWRRKGDKEPFTYEGMEIGFEKVAQVLKDDGPFDGVIGFSQGGALAGMVASLLEPNRIEAFSKVSSSSSSAKAASGGDTATFAYPESFVSSTGYISEPIHQPLRFAVSYSGFGSPHPMYAAFYSPKIQTPMLHFIGSVDTVVDEKRSLLLAHACETEKVMYHPGGHFLPSSQKEYVGALVGFIRSVLEKQEQKTGSKGDEEKAEDMDLPF